MTYNRVEFNGATASLLVFSHIGSTAVAPISNRKVESAPLKEMNCRRIASRSAAHDLKAYARQKGNAPTTTMTRSEVSLSVCWRPAQKCSASTANSTDDLREEVTLGTFDATIPETRELPEG